MIECFRIEEFVIDQLFRPYMSNLLPGDFQGGRIYQGTKSNWEKATQNTRIHNWTFGRISRNKSAYFW